jgi:hypothetical protein
MKLRNDSSSVTGNHLFCRRVASSVTLADRVEIYYKTIENQMIAGAHKNLSSNRKKLLLWTRCLTN